MKLPIQDTCLIYKFVWMFTCTSIGCLIEGMNVDDLFPFLTFSQVGHSLRLLRCFMGSEAAAEELGTQLTPPPAALQPDSPSSSAEFPQKQTLR